MLIKNFSGSSKTWLKNHFNDKYAMHARKQKLRSRAWFKLDEIQKKEKIFCEGMTIVDLGCTPGGWSKYAMNYLGAKGLILACDILPMDPIKGVVFIQGDLREKLFLNNFLKRCSLEKVKVLMSDMSPNISGISVIDMANTMCLLNLALDICRVILIKNGTFLAKMFQGKGCNNFLRKVHFLFKNVKIRKLNTSRSKSREVYIIAKGRIYD